MAKTSKSSANPKTGWLPSLLGAALLVLSGFSLGLIVGIVKDEPELVVGHLSGRSQEISWATKVTPEADELAVAAEADVGLVEPAAESELSNSEFSAIVSSGADMPEIDLPSSRPAAPAARKETGIAVEQLPSVSARRASASRDGFRVQVGAFGTSSSAERVAGDLRKKGYDVHVVSAAQGGKGLWKVRVGPFASKAEADRVSQRLKREEKVMAYVLPEEGG